MERREYFVPHWTEITVGQYQDYVGMLDTDQAKEDDYYVVTKTLQIFLGIEHQDVMEMTEEAVVNLFNSISEAVTDCIENEKISSKAINRVTINLDNGDVAQFGMIPNLRKMKFGEFVDLDNYFKEPKDLHKFLAVLYRQVTKVWKDTYEIEPYKGSDKYAEVMKYFPLHVAMAAKLFFYRLGAKLPIFTQHYLSLKTKSGQVVNLNQISELNGVGTQAFLDLQETHYSKLRTLLKSKSIQPSRT